MLMDRYFTLRLLLGVLVAGCMALPSFNDARAQMSRNLLQQERRLVEVREELPPLLWRDAKKAPSRSDMPVRQGSFEEIAESKRNAIVNIEVDLPENPNFPGLEPVGQGSGFIIHSDGYVLTNAHVVATAKKINVTTSDRQVYTARVVGIDGETDIALLRIEGTKAGKAKRKFPILTLGDSDNVQPGRWVVAIGNPYGLNHTVTAGIVSAVGRRAMGSQLSLRYTNFIQFDAAINLGNSGGPLLDMQGNVIGMNTALQRGNDLGFAIPANMIREVLLQMVRGDMTRSWSGMALRELSVDEARDLPDGRRGTRVVGVLKESPAGNAAIRDGDVVLSYNGQTVEDSDQLRWWIAMSPQNSPQTMVVHRGGRRIDLQISLDAEPKKASSSKAEAVQSKVAPKGPRALGMVVEDLSVDDVPSDAKEKDSVSTGVRVVWIETGSAADLAGLKVGDVITHVNEAPTLETEAFIEAAGAVKKGASVSFRARRGSRRIFIFFTVR